MFVVRVALIIVAFMCVKSGENIVSENSYVNECCVIDSDVNEISNGSNVVCNINKVRYVEISIKETTKEMFKNYNLTTDDKKNIRQLLDNIMFYSIILFFIFVILLIQ